MRSTPDERTNAYDFTVRARNDVGCSAYTRVVTVKVAGAEQPEQQQQEQSGMPGSVVNLQLSAASDSLTGTWQTPASGDAPKRYIVHLKPADGSKGQVKRPKAGKTSVTFRKLESGATYSVSVRAENAAGKGKRTHASVTLPAEDGVQGGQSDPPPEPAPTPEPTPTPAPTPEPQEEPQPEPDQSQEQASSALHGLRREWQRGIDASEAVAATIDYGNGVISRELLDQVLSRCR